MSESKRPLKPAISVKLASIENLVRMAFFSAARNTNLNFLLFKNDRNGKWSIGFLTGVPGYFELWGVPMFFFVELETKPEKAKFFQYTSKEKEKWGFTDSTSEPAKWSYLPIIELAEKPSFLL